MATLDSRGFVDDGSSSLTVGGAVTVAGTLVASQSVPSAMPNNVLVGAVNALTTPGFYQYKDDGVQASIPSAAALPGAMFVFAPYVVAFAASHGGSNIALTGTPVAGQGHNTAVFFQQTSGSAGGTGLSRGATLTTATSGSVALMSNGMIWNVMFVSGALTFS